MRVSSTLLASALAAGASAGTNYLGFNSGATLPDRSAKFKKDFVAEMKTAQGLNGAPGTFNSLRLYTNIQAYSQDDPIEAFDAAIETKTNLLLGVWASGTDNINKEISALKKAVSKYGNKFTDLVIGVSIGSEDLYRDSVTGIKNKAGVGNSPDNIINFIKEYKKAFADNALSKVPVGHIDTWDVWTNSSIKPVIDAVDFIGVDEYPYYEDSKGNDIKNSGHLFDRAYDATIAVANGKPVWVTETGWPSSGPNWDKADASIENAKYYWNEVGCRRLFNKTPTFWYNLRDSNPDNKMLFQITKDLSTKALFDLSCPTTFDTKAEVSSASASATASASASASGTSTGVSKAASATAAASPGAFSANGGSGSSAGAGATGTSGATGAAAGASTTAAAKSSGPVSFGTLSGVASALALFVGALALL
ncbi:GPI-anchored cell wall beta-1,3-endoglucanase EglC [Moelleriella libera RCEF 2490]|uniref:GPI-anchored cell wall beta-1,3-endoglucanase EglC n=1 Tax=Moelleriella libera RCEF 2490 TaxID=1081109 RepID=A0A168EWV3_9HYPO|nr:GPI-anchored cell wall beta-1,3-endoglucanase EglC [Moelleriella libera RCEF 2490]